jgi:predicted PurR-regulated permease PerM
MFTVYFFTLLAFPLNRMGQIIAPFFTPLICAAVLTIALSPVHRHVRGAGQAA